MSKDEQAIQAIQYLYDEVWQRNAALGLVDNAEAGKAYIAKLRKAYHDYKVRLLASTRDKADSILCDLT